MKLATQTLLVYTRNIYLRQSIRRYILNLNTGHHKYYSFNWDEDLNEKLHRVEHFSEVLKVFESIDHLRLLNTILLIDPWSFKGNLSQNLENENKLLAEFILAYPEVKILFIMPGEKFSYVLFGSHKYSKQNRKSKIIEQVNVDPPKNYYPHIFDATDLKKSFELVAAGKSNMFDFSGLRRAIKERILHIDIKATKNNFELLHDSRKTNIALTIDEEDKQAYFNAYALYRYGYSTLPIISNRELKYISDGLPRRFPHFYCIRNLRNFSDIIYAYNRRKLLIVRDYDLQFEDYDYENPGTDTLYKLRGYKQIRHDDGNYQWEYVKENIWECFTDSTHNVGKRDPVYFVTQYKKDYGLLSSESIRNNKNKHQPLCSLRVEANSELSDKNRKLRLRGLSKPLSGIADLLAIIYSSNSGNVNEFLYSTDQMESFRNNDLSGHAISPKILHISKSLIDRAQAYMDEGLYLTSALLSNEALEILNGFHFLEMLRALYIRTISETLLEVENIGVRDDAINVHRKFKEIKALAIRISGEHNTARVNIVNQLAIDLRHLYADKELLESSDACLREYIQNTAGVNFIALFKTVCSHIFNIFCIIRNYFSNALNDIFCVIRNKSAKALIKIKEKFNFVK